MADTAEQNTLPAAHHSGGHFILWTLGVFLALILAVLFTQRESLIGWARTNKIYHLCHSGEWSAANQYYQSMPESMQDSPAFQLVKLHVLLNLGRLKPALEHIESVSRQEKVASDFEHTAALAYLLADKDGRALAILERHPKSPLAVSLSAILKKLIRNEPLEETERRKARQMVEQHLAFQTLPRRTLDYLFARDFQQQKQWEKAAEILQDPVQFMPTTMVFQREYACAQSRLGNYDLATLHFLIARKIIQELKDQPFGETDLHELEKRVLDQSLNQAVVRDASQVWRYVRGLQPLLESKQWAEKMALHPHYQPLAEIFECRAAGLTKYIPYRDPDIHEKNFSSALLPLVDPVLQNPPRQPQKISRPAIADSQTDARKERFIHIIPLMDERVGLFGTGQFMRRTFKRPPGFLQDAALFVRIAGSTRQGLAGGCIVQIGNDTHRLYPPEEPTWFAFPVPLIAPESITVRIEFRQDYVPGFSTKPGDRNLHISEMLVCLVE